MDVRVALCGWTVAQVRTCGARLHGTTGSRHVHTDDELRRLRDLVRGRPSPYVLFNNLPRTGDADRFLALLRDD